MAGQGVQPSLLNAAVGRRLRRDAQVLAAAPPAPQPEYVQCSKIDEQNDQTAQRFAVRIVVESSGTNAGPGRGLVYFTGTDEYRATINKETLDILGLQTIVERKGTAITECMQFNDGVRSTLYVPLYIKLVPPVGTTLWQDNFAIDEPVLVEAEDYAMVTPTYEAVKIEVAVLMRHAADRTFGMSATQRRETHAEADEIMKTVGWTPTAFEHIAGGQPLAESLVLKAKELVGMQADKGTVWRNAKTVDAIRAGARAVASALNAAIIAYKETLAPQ